MTVTLNHLCASMRACVCGGGFFEISIAGVSSNDYTPFI